MHEINKCFVNTNFFIIDKMFSRDGFGPWGVVWWAL